MAIHQDSAAELEDDRSERAMVEPHQQAELWRQIVSMIENEQELLLVRASLIYALSPRAIYALYPDQFANITAIYRMKHKLFKRFQHNQAIDRICSVGMLAPNEDT